MIKKNEQRFQDSYEITLKHHILFWLAYMLFNFLRWGNYFNDFGYSLKTNLIGFPIHISLCYLNIYVFMPKFVFKKKYFTYFVLLIASLFIMLLVKFNLTYYLADANVWPEGPRPINSLTLNYSIDMMMGELYVITFVTAIKITLDFLKENKRAANLEKSHLQTELLFLRNQVSPHFFFNTLNNLYSLSLTNTKKTSKIILKLSDLMRYLLYETKKNRQSLEKEIVCIQNYLELEKIRFNDSLEIDFSITGDITNQKIAPMLLISFVENAFKHGVNKNIGKIKVCINFTIQNNFLYFRIENPLPAETKYKSEQKQKGIGLTNVKKRLALGYQKEDYQLNIEEKENIFLVELKIKTS